MAGRHRIDAPIDEDTDLEDVGSFLVVPPLQTRELILIVVVVCCFGRALGDC